MIFFCLSLHPSQHLHFCCIYPSVITFSYRPTFPSICHCRSNCRFIYLVLQCFRDLFVTDDTRHFAPPIPARFILLVTSFSHPPSACKVEPKYLKESTTGSRSPNRNISSWQFRGLRYSVFFLFIFRPFYSNTLLHFSNSSSTSVLDSAHIARSSANSSPHGGRVPTSDANTSITMTNSKGLKADP